VEPFTNGAIFIEGSRLVFTAVGGDSGDYIFTWEVNEELNVEDSNKLTIMGLAEKTDVVCTVEDDTA